MRSKLGRTAGMCVECVGVVWDCATGVVGVERYTIPVPVRGLSLAPPPGADEEDELRATEPALTGDWEGNATPSCGGALEAEAVEAEAERGVVAAACGWRNPWEGIRRRLGALEGPEDAESGVRSDDASPEGVRRLPWLCGSRRGRGTFIFRGVSAELGEPRWVLSREVRSDVCRRLRCSRDFLEDRELRLVLPWEGESAGVIGVTMLVVEDEVDGVLKPSSSPSRMCPSDLGPVSSPCRLDELPGAERCEEVDVRENVLDSADFDDALESELLVLVRLSKPELSRDRVHDVGGADERGVFGSTPNSSIRLSVMCSLYDRVTEFRLLDDFVEARLFREPLDI